MVRIILIFLVILLAQPAFCSYVSPESYAVNEADMLDYRNIPSAPKLNLDELEDLRFDKKNDKELEKNIKAQKLPKEKKQKAVKEEKPLEKRLSYKFAKWWVDQRYKREEPHHGQKHEIKVKARMEYEQKQAEEALNLDTNSN